MSELIRAIDALLEFVKSFDEPRELNGVFCSNFFTEEDSQRFETLDKVVFLSAFKVGLHDLLPKVSDVCQQWELRELEHVRTIGKSHLPCDSGAIGCGPNSILPGWSIHPSGRWLKDMLALRDVSVSESQRLPIEDSAETQQTHSPDFRSVNWFGTQHEFTSMQAACIKVLWEAWENGTPAVGDSTVLETADSDSERLPLVFRDHEAWGTMIVDGQTKGTHRLADSPEA